MDELDSSMIAQVVEGERSAARRVEMELVRRKGDPDADFHGLLDGLAVAAQSSEACLECLLVVVHQLRLAAPAITKVIVGADQVEDTMQATIMAVERGIGSFKGESRFTTWLHTVARNEALMLIRRRSSRPELDTGEEVDEMAGEGRFSSMIVTRASILDALGELSEIHRGVAELVLVKGLTYAEAADRLGIKVGTVRSRLSAARRQLAETLNP